MKIEHLAYWVQDLEKMKRFYQDYFDGQVGELYFNPGKQFSSYFISFDSGCRLEIMHKPEFSKQPLEPKQNRSGLVHMAISVGSKHIVDSLTEKLRKDGYQVIGEPRTTGDGYYESVILDPELNPLEITV